MEVALGIFSGILLACIQLISIINQAIMDKAEQYYLLRDGESYGPYTGAQLRSMLSSAEVSLDDSFWCEGMKGSMPLGALPGLEQGGSERLPGLSRFPLINFFAEVFRRHSSRDIEECFGAGTRKTTPSLNEVSSTWPSPWIYSRMFFVTLLLYFGFNWAATQFQNPMLVPAVLFIGNFGIPFCLFVLFYELNVRRDVSIYSAGVMMMTGSMLSLVFSLVLFAFWAGKGAIWAGPIEESAKLLAVLLVAHSKSNGRILTGLLLGAAVGAGFAAFESAGFTFMHLRHLMVYRTAADVLSQTHPGMALAVQQVAESSISPDIVMRYRALLTAIAGHTQWTAITAGAYWLVWSRLRDEGILGHHTAMVNFNVLQDWRFLKIAMVPVCVHMFWNSSLLDDYRLVKLLICGLVSWILVLRLLAAGLAQIREARERLASLPPATEL